MELLEAVNTVLPYMGSHVTTRIETSKHPTVDLILAAIERQRITLLSTGWWFNRMVTHIPVNTNKQIDVPNDTLSAIGINCNVVVSGETFYDLDNDTRYFTRGIDLYLTRDIPFNKLPHTAALAITYLAGIEVYTADMGMDNSLTIMQSFANTNMALLRMEHLRNKKFNSLTQARRRSSYRRMR